MGGKYIWTTASLPLTKNLLLCSQIRQLRGQKVTPSSRVTSGGGSTNYQDLCLASPASAEGDFLSSDEDLLPSPLPATALYPSLSGQCHPSPRLDSEGSTDSEAEERVQTHPDPQQLYGSIVCAEALDNWDLGRVLRSPMIWRDAGTGIVVSSQVLLLSLSSLYLLLDADIVALIGPVLIITTCCLCSSLLSPTPVSHTVAPWQRAYVQPPSSSPRVTVPQTVKIHVYQKHEQITYEQNVPLAAQNLPLDLNLWLWPRVKDEYTQKENPSSL